MSNKNPYEGDNVDAENHLLHDMSGVMKKKPTEQKEIKELHDQLTEQRQTLNNLIRENRTLRVKNTNSHNELRNLQNVVSNLENTMELYQRVLGEYSRRLDELENNVIIKNK
jgi:predicted nuclease with TOPRIM domain